MKKLLQAFKPDLFKFLITALLITIPLYPKFPAIRLPGVYVSIRLEDFLIFFTLLIFLIPIMANIKNIIKEKVSRSVILFLLVGFVSTLSGILVTHTTVPSISLLHFFRRVEYLSLFFVGFLYMKFYASVKSDNDKSFFDYIIKLLLLVCFFIFIYGLGQRYLNFPVIITQNEEYSKGIALLWVAGSHINSTFAGHYDLASYMVLTMPIFISAFFVVKNKLYKYLLGASILSGFWLLSVAVSRISIVAFLIATTIFT